MEGSCGIPFYCEELLKNLDHHRVLVFQPMESEEKTNMTWNNLFSESPGEGFCRAGRQGLFHRGHPVGSGGLGR